MGLLKNIFSLSPSLNSSIHLFVIGCLASLLLSGEAQPTAEGLDFRANLPHEPYPYTTLPIKSRFEEGKLDPFRLLAAFDDPGFGQLTFQKPYLAYASESWSWLAVRTTELQKVINVRWVWKSMKGQEFIIEAWNAKPDRLGVTAMIIFRDGKVYQSRHPVQVYLMNFDPYQVDTVTVEMAIDYTVPEIITLSINGYHFSHLRINPESIGAENDFWQMQIFLPSSSTVLVEDMMAWK